LAGRLLPSLITLLCGLIAAVSASAAPIDLTAIGIWSENPGSGAPGSGTGLEKGQKFVVNVSYDPAVTPLTLTTIDGFIYYTVDLSGGAAPPSGGGLVGNGSALDVLVPLEGMDSGAPFIYSADELDHRNHPGDPFPSPVAQLHFRDAAGTDLLGLKLETYDAAVPGSFLQMQTEVANVDPGDGTPVPTGTGVAQFRTGTFDIVIRSINALVDAVPVVAEAGEPLSYSATNLTRTTDGGTFRNVDGTWQDNDLGAGRSDEEDFLTHQWTLLGSLEGGPTSSPLVGSDADAMRPLVLPSENPFVLQPPPSGTRAVEGVNKTVGIADSGLVSTTDVATWQIAVTEDLTGFDGGTDIVLVSYDNAAVSIPVALATPVGNDLQFELDVEDADLAVNGLGLPAFELLSYALLLDGSPFVGLAELLATGSEYLTQAEAIALFGPGMHTLDVRVSDRVLTRDGGYVAAMINFQVVPEPGTGILLLLGLTWAAGMRAERCSRDDSRERGTSR
jgi:hypothetical protein